MSASFRPSPVYMRSFFNYVPHPPLPSPSGSSLPTVGPFASLVMAKHFIHHQTLEEPIRRDTGTPYVQHHLTTADRRYIGKVTIGVLPDDVLVEIFSFYMCEVGKTQKEIWQTLVHVCRRWRSIVFSVPRRLDLQLVCTARTPVWDMWKIWPALPISIIAFGSEAETANILGALFHNDRVREICIKHAWDSALYLLAVALGRPFPELMHVELSLSPRNPTASDLPDSFLGGSAPRLRSLSLAGVPFPALLKLLSSTANLTRLILSDIPPSGYISPEMMVDCLSSLTGLERLCIEFRCETHPDPASRRPPPLTPTVLPVLSSLTFLGVSEYWDRLFTQIDFPVLEYAELSFWDPVIFDTSHLAPFIRRTEPFEVLNQAYLLFDKGAINVTLSTRKGTGSGVSRMFEATLRMNWVGVGWQLWLQTQACCQSPPPSTSELEWFDIPEQDDLSPDELLWYKDDISNGGWLELLCILTAVENLYLPEGLAQCLAPALQRATREGVTGMLPALQNIFIDRLQPSGPLQEAIGEFVAGRQHSGHPVAVQRWVRGKG